MLDLANVTKADAIGALAQGARHEVAELVNRMRESVTWTAREIRLAEWLTGKARVREAADSVEIVVPGGRANEKLGYLLYACLERAWNTQLDTPLALEVEGYTRSNVHGLQII